MNVYEGLSNVELMDAIISAKNSYFYWEDRWELNHEERMTERYDTIQKLTQELNRRHDMVYVYIPAVNDDGVEYFYYLGHYHINRAHEVGQFWSVEISMEYIHVPPLEGMMIGWYFVTQKKIEDNVVS